MLQHGKQLVHRLLRNEHAFRRRDAAAAGETIVERDLCRRQLDAAAVAAKLGVRAVILKLDRDHTAARISLRHLNRLDACLRGGDVVVQASQLQPSGERHGLKGRFGFSCLGSEGAKKMSA